MKMGQFMKVLTSAGVALALSFLFYDQQDLSGESYRGQPARGTMEEELSGGYEGGYGYGRGLGGTIVGSGYGRTKN